MNGHSAPVASFGRAIEDGDYLGTCDWGHCDRIQAGWAISDFDNEWLAICSECAAGRFPERARFEAIPVVQYITFAEVWNAYAGTSVAPDWSPLDPILPGERP